MDACRASDECAIERTAKSCGPDTSTPVSTSQSASLRVTVAESPITGESAKEAVKTIAQETPDDPALPVVTTLVCFLFFAREAVGASIARHSLRP